MSIEKRIVSKLHKILEEQNRKRITTSEFAEATGLSRSVCSNYLNKLFKAKLVKKTKNRPVEWYFPEIQLESGNNIKYFDNYIGKYGSQKDILAKCIAAVKYPPKGLNILITGPSGTGKSYLAENIYEYAKSTHIINDSAKFLTLNCADYANNPELLSSVLFGYKKGAFTGAVSDYNGFLKNADGGILFLDEVHRLSGENQEKLFQFLDTGNFYPVGENTVLEHSEVRLIFATTENTDDTLLTTFMRRVPVHVTLLKYSERPLIERSELLEYLFLAEARRLNKSISVSEATWKWLLNEDFEGNVGKIKNEIRMMCAISYSQIAKNIKKIEIGSQKSHTIQIDVNANFLNNIELLNSFSILINKAIKKSDEVDTARNNLMKCVQENITCELLDPIIYAETKEILEKNLQQRFGIKIQKYFSVLLAFMTLKNVILDTETLKKWQDILKMKCPRTIHVAKYATKDLQSDNQDAQLSLTIILAIMISDQTDENIGLQILLISHGSQTASSIQAVVNQLGGNYLVDAIDMPIDISINKTVEKTLKLITEFKRMTGFILMIDMGSLSQLYNMISGELDSDLLVINNLTTATALDVALKVQSHQNFKEISKYAKENYTIESQYYSGFSQRKNIIISCMSGLGISEKIKDIMEPFMPEKIELNVLEYKDLKELIAENEENYFANTIFILTTSSLPKKFAIPNLNVYDILDQSGKDFIHRVMNKYLSKKQLYSLDEELLRFFSLEGIAERLMFLNPNIIMNDVETIIFKYENYYEFSLDGKIKLNLYMHIALMIERLMSNRTRLSIDNIPLSAEAKEFYKVTKDIFKPIALKYNVVIDDYEISLLFEIFKLYIKKD